MGSECFDCVAHTVIKTKSIDLPVVLRYIDVIVVIFVCVRRGAYLEGRSKDPIIIAIHN